MATMSPSPKPNNIQTQPGADLFLLELRLRRDISETERKTRAF
jgi:hypothetical protein